MDILEHLNFYRILINFLDGVVATSVMHMYFSEKIRTRLFVVTSFSIGLYMFMSEILLLLFPSFFLWPLLTFTYCIMIASTKTSVNKSLHEVIVPVIVFIILNMIYPSLTFLYLHTLQMDVQTFLYSYRYVLINLLFYIISFSVLYFVRRIVAVINYKIKINTKKTIIFATYTILILITLTINAYVFFWYKGKGINIYTAISLLLILILYSVFDILFYFSLCKSENVKNEERDQNLYSKKIKAYNRELGIIKHRYDNILATISGFIYKEQWDQLREYLEQVIKDNEISGNALLENGEIVA